MEHGNGSKGGVNAHADSGAGKFVVTLLNAF
jgi:hypothetical protein